MPRIGDYTARVRADAGQYVREMRRAGEATTQLQVAAAGVGGALRGVGVQLAAMGAAATAAFVGINRLSASMRETAANADTLVNAARATGVELGRFQSYAGLFGRVGLDVADVRDVLTELNVKIGDFATGSATAVEAVTVLDLRMRNLDGTLVSNVDLLDQLFEQVTDNAGALQQFALDALLTGELAQRLTALLQERPEQARRYLEIIRETQAPEEVLVALAQQHEDNWISLLRRQREVQRITAALAPLQDRWNEEIENSLSLFANLLERLRRPRTSFGTFFLTSAFGEDFVEVENRIAAQEEVLARRRAALAELQAGGGGFLQGRLIRRAEEDIARRVRDLAAAYEELNTQRTAAEAEGAGGGLAGGAGETVIRVLTEAQALEQARRELIEEQNRALVEQAKLAETVNERRADEAEAQRLRDLRAELTTITSTLAEQQRQNVRDLLGGDPTAGADATAQQRLGLRRVVEILARQRQLNRDNLALYNQFGTSASDYADEVDRALTGTRSYVDEMVDLQNQTQFWEQNARDVAELSEGFAELSATAQRSSVFLAGFGVAIGDALSDAILNARDLDDVLKGLVRTIAQSAITSFIGVPLGNFFSSLAGRQHGGPVAAGRPYIVGEAGPELFVPQSAGAIATNAQLRDAGGAGGLTVIVEGVQDPETVEAAIYNRVVPLLRGTLDNAGSDKQFRRSLR